MAKRLWEQITAGTDIKLWVDPELYNKDDVMNERDYVQDLLNTSDAYRTELAQCRGYPDLESFDAYLQDQLDSLDDLLDTFAYNTRVATLTVMDGAWFSPDSVQSVLAEDVGNEAVRSIDGNTVTFFRDSTNHQHELIYNLRNYPKKVSKIRFFYGAGTSARERLNNVSVHASAGLANIDDPENILETGINITWPVTGGVWVEHTLAQKKNKARYVKIIVGDTDNANNHMQVREFEIWVEPKDPT